MIFNLSFRGCEGIGRDQGPRFLFAQPASLQIREGRGLKGFLYGGKTTKNFAECSEVLYKVLIQSDPKYEILIHLRLCIVPEV